MLVGWLYVKGCIEVRVELVDAHFLKVKNGIVINSNLSSRSDVSHCL